MFVSDLRHFLDMPDDAPRPARAMAEQLFDLVRAATAGDPGRRVGVRPDLSASARESALPGVHGGCAT